MKKEKMKYLASLIFCSDVIIVSFMFCEFKNQKKLSALCKADNSIQT